MVDEEMVDATLPPRKKMLLLFGCMTIT